MNRFPVCQATGLVRLRGAAWPVWPSPSVGVGLGPVFASCPCHSPWGWVRPSLSVCARPRAPPAEEAHGACGLLREWGPGRAQAGLGLTPGTGATATPQHPVRRQGDSGAVPQNAISTQVRSGKKRDLVFYLSWASLLAPVGLGPSE